MKTKALALLLILFLLCLTAVGCSKNPGVTAILEEETPAVAEAQPEGDKAETPMEKETAASVLNAVPVHKDEIEPAENVDISAVQEQDIVTGGAAEAKINDEKHLVVTDESGNTVDLGYVGGENKPNAHVVSFLNADNSVISVQYVEDGKDAVPPKDPILEGHEFIGWKGSYRNVKADTVVMAAYTKKEQYFTVTFCDYDGTVLVSEKVAPGQSATVPEASPTRSGYSFAGWDGDYTNVTEDKTVTAKYIAADMPCITVGSASLSGDDEVRVEISLQNNPGICSLNLNVSLESGLILSGYEINSGIFKGTALGPQTTPATGTVSFLWAQYTKNMNDNGTFVTLYLKKEAGATGKKRISVSYDPDNVFDIQERNVEFATSDGYVNISD